MTFTHLIIGDLRLRLSQDLVVETKCHLKRSSSRIASFSPNICLYFHPTKGVERYAHFKLIQYPSWTPPPPKQNKIHKTITRFGIDPNIKGSHLTRLRPNSFSLAMAPLLGVQLCRGFSLYRTFTSSLRYHSAMANFLVEDPKYSWLKELGINTKNQGVYHGKWGGSGQVNEIKSSPARSWVDYEYDEVCLIYLLY